MPPVNVGLKLAPEKTTIDELRAVWRVADEAGFDGCWIFDHFAGIFGDPAVDVFEAWSLLGSMAAETSRTRIGCMVTGNTYRHPGVLAKAAVTVDHLSGGRLDMGIGAGWAEIEHTMLALEFGTAGRRVEWLDEACQVLKALWTEERASFRGERYTITDAVANPKPVQKPWPPLWIGGRGERKTLRVVAKHADVWNVVFGEPDEVARLSGVLDEHCAAVGRDPSEIRRSVQIRWPGDGEELVHETERYVARGFTEPVIALSPGNAEADAEAVAAVLPRLRSLG